jgi:NAD(P)-dependent dehydrogenase (short-subunit alcohol dehydrogenase family)
MAKGRTVLITGAASGIGAAIAERFSGAGDSVAYFDLNAEAARATALAINLPGKKLFIQGDAAKEQDARSAIAQTVSALGPLEVLVNNVGIEINGTVLEQNAEEWDHHVNVNLRSAFLFSKFAIPEIERGGGGSIINIASVHSYMSWPRCPAYDTTKAGLLGLTRALAVDHGQVGIRVNAVAPGYIVTPLLERWFASGSGVESEALKVHPLRRLGKPSDVAHAVHFLASDEASFITGTCLTVDGGLTALGH